MEFKTISSTQTKKIAGLLAKEISTGKLKRKNALVLALAGDLGSGKTTFAQGFLRGLGIRKKVTSPTFVIAKKYNLKTWSLKHKTQKYKYVWHLDCYRIQKPSELFGLGFKGILADPRNVVLIEWPEVIKKVLPKNIIWIKFEHGKKENQRTINFRSV